MPTSKFMFQSLKSTYLFGFYLRNKHVQRSCARIVLRKLNFVVLIEIQVHSRMKRKVALKKQEAKQLTKTVEITTAEQIVATQPVVTHVTPSLNPKVNGLI